MLSRFFQYVKKNKYVQYMLVYVAIMAILHVFMREYDSDTVGYYSRASWEEPSFGIGALYRLLKYRYESWTSRIVLEAPLFVLTHGMHQLLWSVINLIMHGILYVALDCLTDHKHSRLLLLTILLYPVYEMGTAGWITCYIIYWWTLTLVSISLLSLKVMHEDGRLSVVQMIICVMCEFYATSLEQFAGLYLGILVLFTMLMIADQRFTPSRVAFTVIQYVICIGNIVFALTGPGNHVKEGYGVWYWFPDYDSLTIVDKMVMAVNTTMSFLTEKSIIWFVFVVLILMIVLVKYPRDVFRSAVAAFPVAITIIRSFLSTAGKAYFPDYMYILDVYSDAARVDPTNYNSPSGYIPFILYMTVVTAVLCSIVWICIPDSDVTSDVPSLDRIADVRETWVLLYVIILGFAVRGVMGFSPTIYASSQRTFMVTEFVLIYLIQRLYGRQMKLFDVLPGQFHTLCRIGMICLAVLSVINNLLTITNRYYYG